MTLALITEALAYRVTDALTALAPLAAVVLGGVFVLAALTKLTDPATTSREFGALGLPRPSLLARVVPPAELVVAGLLVLRPTIGAPIAAVLLLAFSAVLVAALRSGRTVSCGCLGALSREPISVTTLVRNGGLLALAALAAAGRAPSGLRPVLPALDVVLASGLTVLLILLGHQLLALRNQIGRLWSVELAGEGRPMGRRQAKQTHDDRAVMNGVGS